MPKYLVTIPICGSVTVEVEAENEEEAKELALESEQVNDFDRIEYDVVEHIVEGNFFFGSCNSIDIQEADE